MWIAIAAATLVGSGLRFYALSARDFWLDESLTFVCIRDLFERGPDAPLFVQSTNLLYYLLLRGWAEMFGDGPASLRAFSALAASLCIPILARSAWLVAGARAAIVAALFVSLHTLHVYYAHEARSYAFWTFTLSLALWLWIEAIQRDRPAVWLASGLAWLACLFAHALTIYALPFAALAAHLLRRGCLRAALVTLAGTLLAYAPFGLFVVWPVVQAGTSAWIADDWNPATALPRSLWALQSAGAYPYYLHGLSLESTRSVAIAALPLAMLAALAPAVLASAALAVAILRRPLELVRGPIAALGWLALGPLALMWLQSVALKPAYLVGRYDLVAWPAACLFTALLLTRACELVSDARPGTWLTAICVALAIAASLPITRFLAYENLGG